MVLFFHERFQFLPKISTDYTHEITFDVTKKDITILCEIGGALGNEPLQSFDTEKGSLPLTAGIAVVYEFLFKEDERYESLICYYRDSLHRDGLILFCEADANGKVGYENESDGCILCYEKAQLENPPSFSEGEAAALDDYAKGCEARQAFIDLSPFAYVNGRQIGKNEAEEFALNKGQDIITDEKRGICRILCGGKGENAVFESMKNTKAKLELISELGFRGVSFDIMRTPIYDLMMAAASFYLGTDYFSSSLPM